MTANQTVDVVALIVRDITTELAHSLKQDPERVPSDLAFADMGADSLILVEALQEINRRYRVTLTVGDMYENINTIAKLARHIHAHGEWQSALAVNAAPARAAAEVYEPQAEAPADAELPAVIEAAPRSAEPGSLEQIVRHQLELMERQLSLLTKGRQAVPGRRAAAAPARTEARPRQTVEAVRMPEPAAPAEVPNDRLSAFAIRLEADGREREPEKVAHIAALAERFNRKTPNSKRMAQEYRRVLADNRVSAGFRPLLKEIVYPVIAEQGRGARLTDIDGNEYVDYTMGFGVYLFGHLPDFVTEAIRRQLDRGIPIGPQSPLAGRVAQLVCELTGHERVVYCNSGSEATMTAVRLARAKTGRSKVVIFRNSYHGTFDGFLARANAAGVTRPGSLGTPDSLVQDTVVLDYCERSALDYIARHASEIAAVLVEPVQSRAPSLRPGPFLAELRRLTQAHDVALIFDEIISGFRCAPGGAQEYFGVKADICTYGKIVGGGMPIGLVAGSAAYMDGIDGGWWQYGDSSAPTSPTIFFAGTFSKHPLAVAAAVAVLEHIKAAGRDMYRTLNDNTARLAERLNAVFESQGVDISVEYFSSLFRFASKGNLDLFYYHLLDAGIFIWEGRNCFVSTAHTAQDLERLVTAVAEVCRELAPRGLVPLKEGARPRGEEPFPLADAQRRFYALERRGTDGSIACNICYGIRFDAPVDVERLARAVTATLQGQEALWYRFDVAQGTQRRTPAPAPAVEILTPPAGSTCERLLEEEQATAFDLAAGANVRARIYRLDDSTLLSLCAHHLVCDGWGLTLLLQRIAANYDEAAPGAGDVPYTEWIRHETEYRQSPQYSKDKQYWYGVMERIAAYQKSAPPGAVPHDCEIRARPGARATLALETPLAERIVARAKADGATPFTWLLCNFQIFLNRVFRERLPVIGIPFANRNTSVLRRVVGTCANLLPLLPFHEAPVAFEPALAYTKQAMNEMFVHCHFPYHEMCGYYQSLASQEGAGPVALTFNVEPISEMPRFGNQQPVLLASLNRYIEFDLMFNLFVFKDRVAIELDYNPERYPEDQVYGWLNLYGKIVELNTARAASEAAPEVGARVQVPASVA